MPRILKDPVGCSASSLSQTSLENDGAPAVASTRVSAALCTSGVRMCKDWNRGKGEKGRNEPLSKLVKKEER
jgi:hypothetical protein